MALSKIEPVKQFKDDDLITCGICHIEIQHPRSLLCLHTYCLGCLREWSKNRKDVVICPLCREPTPLPPNGVDGLRSNFFVAKLKDRKAVSRQLMDKDVKIVCTSCDVSDGNEAVARCLECDDFLCSKCVKIHKSLRILKHHKVFTLDDLRSGKADIFKQKEEEFCGEHKGQVLWFFCKTCGVPICRDCTVVDHPTTSHELVKLCVAIVGQREEIQELAKSCEQVRQGMKTSLEEIESKIKDLDLSYATATAAIEEAGANAIELVTKEIHQRCSEKKEQVTSMKAMKAKQLSDAVDKLQTLESRLDSALEMAKQVTDSGSDCDVASVYSSLVSTLKQLRQEKSPTISCSISTIRFVGDKSPAVWSISLGRVVGSVHYANATWKLDRTFGETGEGTLKYAKGLAVTINGDVAVADGNASRINIYNINDGSFRQVIDTTNSNSTGKRSYPRDVVMHCDGSFIVTDGTDHPFIYDSTGSYMRQITNRHDNLTRGIAVNSHGHVLVGYSNKILEIHNFSDEKLESTLDVPFGASYITVSSDDQIIISADSSAGAQVIDSRGKTIHTLRPPANVTASWRSTGICTFGEGEEEEIFICNRSGTPGVYRFSLTTGKYLGCVTTELKVPHGIALTDDGQLVVADQTCIKVFIVDGRIWQLQRAQIGGVVLGFWSGTHACWFKEKAGLQFWKTVPHLFQPMLNEVLAAVLAIPATLIDGGWGRVGSERLRLSI